MRGDATNRSEASQVSTSSPFANGNRSPGQARWGSQQRKPKNPENKRARDAVSEVAKTLKMFKRKHLGDGSNYDFGDCSDCIEDFILREWHIASKKITDSAKFLRLTLEKPLTQSVMESNAYVDLLSLSQRAQDFDILVPDARRKITNCLTNHVIKNCKSQKDESGDDTIFAAEEYETSIAGYKSEIDAKDKETSKKYSEYKEITTPFLDFVRRGEMHTALMSDICGLLLDTCSIILQWIREDDEYPDRLTKEMADNVKQKEALKNSCVANHEKIEANRSEMKKATKQCENTELEYWDCRREKARLKYRQNMLKERTGTIEEKITAKEQERDELSKEEGGPSSGRMSFRLTQRMEELDTELQRLAKEKEVTSRQVRRVNKDFKQARERAYEYKVECAEKRNHLHDLECENQSLAQENEESHEKARRLDILNVSIQRLREMKLSPEAYRKKLRLLQKRETTDSNARESLMDAFKFAAPSIGRDWKKLYLLLPFDPPRGMMKRQIDVENLDLLCAKRDVTEDEQALQSLFKWRSFHRRGNVKELIRTLTDTHKEQVALELREKFVAPPV